jgi:hypothetical protein
VGSRLATWVESPEGQAYKWTLIIEGTSILAKVVQKGIERQHGHPKEFPLPLPVLVEIFSVQWELIFLGFGTLIGSFIATARTRSPQRTAWSVYSCTRSRSFGRTTLPRGALDRTALAPRCRGEHYRTVCHILLCA